MLAVLLIAGSIAVHHGAMGLGDTHADMAMSAVAEFCLGVFTAVGAAIATVALGALRLGRWRPPAVLSASGLIAGAPVVVPRSRAGPVYLTFLCVSRC